MKTIGRVEVETVIDVRCDVCSASTRVDMGGFQFGSLQAKWGFGSAHDGERYEIHLCEGCFFQALAYLRQERRSQNMFSADDGADLSEDLGLVAKNDYFGDSGG
ncbi:hypothetical protein [Pseudomonas amygdali]|uniref:hypothetical protein n=1 Tax=Pseudomonas amygdali TaxID=47877 RepID=UPI000EFEADD2|nr:hypothetical protein [Pseudomonas amygdali]RMV06416.1 hypothetical protein ALP18_200341 [Pseudomonas amygdali pv. myricae]RMV23332.1 hypothetical protein ALP14_02130 [Pseudomonas amygdali pv. myricae]